MKSEENYNYDAMIQFRLYSEEKQLIQHRASRVGFDSLSHFARVMLLQGYIIHIDRETLQELFDRLDAFQRQVAGASTNLNQIAKRFNAGSILPGDLADIKQASETLMSQSLMVQNEVLKFFRRSR